jgi:hypothetical protein
VATLAQEARMTLEELGNLGDFVAALGVIASLLFVGLQMRTNSRLLRATAVQGSADFFTQAITMEFAKNPDLNRVWGRMASGSWDDLSEHDRGVAVNLIIAVFNTADRVHVQREERLIPVYYWNEVFNWMRFQFLPMALVRQYWARVVIPGGTYSPAFVEEITCEIAAVGDRVVLVPWTRPTPPATDAANPPR